MSTIGEGRCSIVDTWWQTETGGILISPIRNCIGTRPGAATHPLPGIRPALLTAEGEPLDGAAEGALVATDSWPGQIRTVYGDHQRFVGTYFSTFPGYYFTGDGGVMKLATTGSPVGWTASQCFWASPRHCGNKRIGPRILLLPKPPLLGFHTRSRTGVPPLAVCADGTDAATDAALKQQGQMQTSQRLQNPTSFNGRLDYPDPKR